MNIIEPLLQHATTQPSKRVLIHQHEHRTYEQLVGKMKKIANGLQQKELKNERIAIFSSNRLEMVEVLVGIIYSGNIPVILDPKWSKKVIHSVLQQAKPKLIFTEEIYEELFARYEVITFSKSYETWCNSLTDEAVLKTNECLFIAFTSGTTGTPKGYVRTHTSWIESFKATKEAFELEQMEHVLAPGPFVQSLSLFALMQTMIDGGTFHLLSRFNETDVYNACKQFPNMILYVVPTMIEKMIQIDSFKETNVQAIISSGAKWTNDSKKRAKNTFPHTKFFEFYGSSEASYISYAEVNNIRKEHSVGAPFSGVELSIRDVQFNEVSTGNMGQLFVRSNMMFTSYFNLPTETEKVFHKGWLKTGDLAFIDEDGELHLVGREKNRLITGGFNVYPEEVETVLLQLREVDEVIIVGVPDTLWGERLVACIKWKDEPLSIHELRQFGKQYLENFKLPKEIVTVSSFIYTSSGKIARQKMKDFVMEETT